MATRQTRQPRQPRKAAGAKAVEGASRPPLTTAVSAEDGPGAQVIISAAVDEMAEHGYHGTSVRDIARRAGMSSAALYHHFHSKDELLFIIMDRGIDELVRRTSEALAAAGDDPGERLRAVVRVHVLGHVQSQRESFLGNSELRSLDRPQRSRIIAKRDKQMRLFEAVVADGVERGVFTTPYPADAAKAIVTMCTAVATW